MYPGQQQPPWQQQPQYPSQYPQYPQPQPGYEVEYSYSTSFERTYNLDYTNQAWAAAWLYMVGYVPGLVMSIVYLSQAHRTQRETGHTVYGMGCLWTTLIIGLIPAAFVVLLIILAMLVTATGTWSQF